MLMQRYINFFITTPIQRFHYIVAPANFSTVNHIRNFWNLLERDFLQARCTSCHPNNSAMSLKILLLTNNTY